MNLTKRETILLLVLLLVAVLFVEYQFVIIPGLERYTDLTLESERIQKQVDGIHTLIASAPGIRDKRDRILADVSSAGKPFYDSLNTDALLWSTHDLLVKSGLAAVSYSTSELGLAMLDTKQAQISGLTYKLSELAASYAGIGNAKPADAAAPTPSPSPAPAPQSGDKKSGDVELYSVNVSFIGSYDQIRNFISSIEALKKTITVSMLSLEPAGVPDKLKGLVMINYYGARKIVIDQDQTNTWSLSPYKGGSGSPFSGNTAASGNGQPVSTMKPR